MKTDAIFYHLFQAYPAVFFELIGQAGEMAVAYEFTSVELKELANWLTTNPPHLAWGSCS